MQNGDQAYANIAATIGMLAGLIGVCVSIITLLNVPIEADTAVYAIREQMKVSEVVFRDCLPSQPSEEARIICARIAYDN